MSKRFFKFDRLGGSPFKGKTQPDTSRTLDGASQPSMSSSSVSTTSKVSRSKSPSSAQLISHAKVPNELTEPLPLWLNPLFATRHIVKGSFITLSICPEAVDRGEWIAHQVVEQHRNVLSVSRVVCDKEDDGTSLCNPLTCPKMSAEITYAWQDGQTEPRELPAHEYMTLAQQWISEKIDDASLFPTDPASVSYAHNSHFLASTPLQKKGSKDWLGKRSGFPEEFSSNCELIFRHIFRVYAHLYWNHFNEPFYHLGLEGHLNSLFAHFISTATTLRMLRQDELNPMRALIDLWIADGTLPPLFLEI